ncbi:MAG: 4-hydroxybenzoate octaprenyltransferase [Candidatus Marinimicrobia bacterium]|nr:4-hydroxybenzoate octaprenyltransferase [Candidatus Neomarinimicrobiota bacterium]|tara:strand:+ start:5740 stop:6603 length:864 start_codon:yes stop_codon:yes gene_type:complete
MLDSLVFKKFTNYLELIRFNRPIGFLLLMWPCWFGLSILELEIITLISWLLIFFLGSFFMRSAGCIINDIIDRNIDKLVKRTKSRPIASNNVSLTEAILLLIFFLLLGLLVLLQFNLYSIFCGVLSIPFIILYPFMKRITYWPQVFLGIVFSWGVLIVSIQFNQLLNLKFVLLYLACVFWTLGYDTIYAYQDREDDIKQNIKSTAVYFGPNGRWFIKFCYAFVVLIFAFLGWNSSNSIFSLIIIAILGICTYIAIQKWDINSSESSNFYFRQNNIFALMLFIYLLIF